MNSSPESPPKARAFEKVRTYLHQNLKVNEKTENFRLPPIREISEKAGVSPSSARNVLLSLAQKGQVEIFPGSGTFWIPEFQRKKETLVIGVNRGIKPEEPAATFHGSRFYGAVVNRAMKAGIEVKFKPFVCEPIHSEQINFSDLEKSIQGVDCCLLSFPFAGMQKVVEFIEELSIPCFFYNPLSPDRLANFLSPDYYGAAKRIGRVWGRTGRKQILLMQAPGLHKSTSCELLYTGMLCGLGLEQEMLPEVYRVDAPNNERISGFDAFHRFVARTGKVPDAVHCTTDRQAFGVLDAARELNIETPTAMSVIGNDGNSWQNPDPTMPMLTAMEHPIEQIGDNFIHLFRKRGANQMNDVPGIYFPMRLLIGQTTRPQENELFSLEDPKKDAVFSGEPPSSFPPHVERAF